ncbi:MAG: hypothetical protein N3C12_05495 [Candidatus Binatia bacterium]|nr:hypothetical protein [Candidatus Binatia bacterium]
MDSNPCGRQATRLRLVLVGFLLLLALELRPSRAGAADYEAWNWVYKSCHGRFADVVASGFGTLIGLPAAGLCGVVLLPADVAHEIRHPEDRFLHYSRAACVKPFAAVGGAAYLLMGAPFYAAQWLVWDLPHGPCPAAPRTVPKPPETTPASAAE